MYEFDIKKVNASNKPDMNVMFTMKRDFDMDDLSPSAHSLLSKSFSIDSEKALEYYKLRHKGGLEWQHKFLGAECDFNCRRLVYCDTNTQLMGHKFSCYGNETIKLNAFFEKIVSYFGGPWVQRALLRKSI